MLAAVIAPVFLVFVLVLCIAKYYEQGLKQRRASARGSLADKDSLHQVEGKLHTTELRRELDVVRLEVTAEVRAKLKLLETTGEDEEDSACLPRSTNFDCLLSSLEPGPSRRVIVNFEHEQSRHEVLRVRCASRSRKLLLELRVQLLHFRECDQGGGQCIAFNARGQDIEWWVLQFNHCREMIRFQQRIPQEMPSPAIPVRIPEPRRYVNTPPEAPTIRPRTGLRRRSFWEWNNKDELLLVEAKQRLACRQLRAPRLPKLQSPI